MRLTNYWWLLIWPLLFLMLGFVANLQRTELVNGQRCLRWRPIAAMAFVIPYVIWAGERTQFGDTEMYRHSFQNLPVSFSEIGAYMNTVKKGPGFQLFELLFKVLISHSDVAFFLLVAAIQLACLVYVYRKYSPSFWLSMFFFIASTDYLSWMFNGIRQFLAASLVFLCVPLIAKRKYVLAVLITLLASTIHISALVFLPFIFIVNGRSWNLRTLLFIVAIIAGIVFVDRVTGFITQAMEDTVYEGDLVILQKDDGTNIFRVLFYSVPAVMAWMFRPYLDKTDDYFINICANLSIISAGFYVFSFFSSGILIGRLPIYFSLSNYILIPWLIQNAFTRDSAMVIDVSFAMVYTVFFYYQCGISWGLL